MKRILKSSFLLFLLVFTCSLWIPRLRYMSGISRLDADTVQSGGFREQPIDTQTARQISGMEAPGEYLAGERFWKTGYLTFSGRRPDGAETLGKGRRLERLPKCLPGSVG